MRAQSLGTRAATVLAILIGATPVFAQEVPPEVAASRTLREAAATLAPLPDTGSGITRDVGGIAVIEHDGSNYDKDLPDGTGNYAPRAAVALRFYQTHPDDYDFLVVFTTFPFEKGDATAFHGVVRNDVAGIGLSPIDNGILFGSASRLKGVTDMAHAAQYHLSPFSMDPAEVGFSRAAGILLHEIGHQWLARVRYHDPEGAASSALLGRNGSHWSALLDSDASFLYGSDWVPRADGSFVAERVQDRYSALDLYLMGLLEPSGVPPLTLLRNPGLDPTALPVEGAVVSGDPVQVTLDRIVAAEGARSPDALHAQKEFRAAFILLTRPGVDATDEELAAVEAFRRTVSGRFFALTGGVAVLDASLHRDPTSTPGASPDVDRALAWLLAQQSIDGRWEDRPGTAPRDTAAALAALVRQGRTGPALDRGWAWLGAAGASNLDFLSRSAEVRAARLTAAERSALSNLILSFQNDDGGFGAGIGYASDALDTALALRALAALDHDAEARVRGAVDALRAARSPSGGWAFVTGGPVSTVATAHVLSALQSWASEVPDAAALFAAGLPALLAQQNPDGGFGESPSTPYATALALDALLRAGAPEAMTAGALAWLRATQSPNGSWSDSRFDTALVIGVLRASTTNLTVPMDGLVLDPPAAEEGDTVRVTAQVRNAGRAPSSASRARLFDGPPAEGRLIEDVSVPALEPGAEAAVAFTFPTTDRPGTRTLYVVADATGEIVEAREDDNTASRSLSVAGLLPDLTVSPTDLSIAPEPPAVGEATTVSVAVSNRGARAAGPVTVRVLVRRQSAVRTVLAAGLSAVPPGEVRHASVSWTPDEAGVFAVEAIVDAAHAVTEEDETNNGSFIDVEVDAAVPSAPDFTVRDVLLDPSVLRRVGDEVRVRARVGNRGAASATAVVDLHDGDPASGGTTVGQQSVPLPGRTSAEVVFTFRPAAAGTRPIVMLADPAGLVPEADETNNRGAATLVDPRNTLDIEVRPDGVVSPASPRAGDVVEISAVLQNRGTVPVVGIPVFLAHGVEGARRELVRQDVTLAPAEVTTVVFSWRVGLLGDPLVLHVVADPFDLLDEVAEDNNEASVSLAVQGAGLPNWRLTSSDLAVDPDPPREGRPAVITVVVSNAGEVAAPPTVVRVYANDPGAGAPWVAEAPVPSLDPGARVSVAASWPSVETRDLGGLTAIVDPEGQTGEFDETDNRAFRQVGVIGLPDLVLGAADVRLEPPFPREGQAVTVRTTVRNLGGQESAPSRLRLYDGEPTTGSELAAGDVPALGPGTSAEVAVTWIPPPSLAEHVLSVVVDPDDGVREADEGNNSVRRSVVVQDADLYVTAVYFSPNGDGVQDTTTLAYRTTAPVDILVSGARGQLVRQLAKEAPAAGTAEWDGRDHRGVLVGDGEYTFTLRDTDGVVHGRTTAILDLNRSSLFDAAGTRQIRMRALTCRVETLGPTTWMPGEDALLMIQPASGETPAGLVRLDLGGTVAAVHRGEWYEGARFPSEAAVDPTGREVLVTKGGELFAVDLATGVPRPLAGGVTWAEWSPDGQRIAVDGYLLNRDGSLSAELPGGHRFVWSPDAERLASSSLIVGLDGAVLHAFEVQRQVVQVAWRGDGTLFVRGRDDDPEEADPADAFLVDGASGAVTPIPWLRDPRIQSVWWSSDTRRVLLTRLTIGEGITHEGTFVAAADGANATRLTEDDVVPSPAFASGLANGGRPAQNCLGFRSYDLHGVVNLQNLSADLEATRLPANTGIQLRGTAADRHLEHYQLEYASVLEPATWHPIGAPSDVPVIDDGLATWVPPGPGTFLLRLQVADRAGNRRAVVRSASWDRVPPITNVTATELLISPNGDGRKDGVTFRYLVVEPTRVEVHIEGPLDAEVGAASMVRQMAFDHASAWQTAEFAWDGRDEGGQVVPDGRYRVVIDDLPFHVDVDVTPPELLWEYADVRAAIVLESLFPPELSGAFTLPKPVPGLHADRLLLARDEHLKAWGAGPFHFTEALFEYERDETGAVVYDDGVPRPRRVAGHTMPQTVVTADSFEIVDFATRSSEVAFAQDHAGNVSHAAVVPLPERLLVVSASIRDEVSRIGRPVISPPISPTQVYALNSGDRVYASVQLAETMVGSPNVTLEYRADPSGPWVAVRSTTIEGIGGLSFKSLNLPEGDLYGRFVARLGTPTVTSEEFRFRACEAVLSLDVEASTLPGGLDHARVLVRGMLPEPLQSATLTVVVDNPLAPFRSVVQMRPVDGPDGVFLEADVLAPTPECGMTLTYDAVLRGQSGTVYRDGGGCRKLRRSFRSQDCLSQEFDHCEGSADALHLVGAFAVPSPDAAIRIEHGPAASPVVIARLEGPATRSIDTHFDVAGIAEGDVEVRAYRLVPGQSDFLVASKAFVVDRTPVELDVITPEENGVVCAAEPLYRARSRREDADLLQEVRRPDGTWSPICNATPCGDGAASLPADAIVPLLFHQPRLEHGPHRLRLRACDRAGNRTNLERDFLFQRQPLELEWASVPFAAFSPNADGRRDLLLLDFTSSQSTRVRLEVRRADSVVRTAEADVVAGAPAALIWDGRDNGGSPVSDGLYSIRLGAADACGGQGDSLNWSVRVDTQPPVALIAAPVEGQTVGASLDVVGTATDELFSGYELSAGFGADPPSFTSFAGGAGPVDGGLLGRWAPPSTTGPYTLRLVAHDEAANLGTATVHVVVEPRSLLDGLTVTDAFSPNGDGRREQASIEYRTLAEVRVTVHVRDGSGVVIRTLQDDVPRSPGTHVVTWAGDLSSADPAPEGTYVVVVSAEPLGGGAAQQESAALLLDRTPPVFTVLEPESGAVVPPDRPVVATVSDPHLTLYRVSAVVDGTEVVLSTGHAPVSAAALGVLGLLPDGPHTLLFRAEDVAENVTELTRPVVLDSQPPSVAVAEPANGGVVARGGAHAVSGRLLDLNPLEFVLGVGDGADPAAFDEIGRGTTAGDSTSFGTWRDEGHPDGVYTLRVVATDAAGHQAEARTTITLDGTPPEAQIAVPVAGAALNHEPDVLGTARDVNLESWQLEAAPGGLDSAFQWTRLASGTESLINQALASWTPLPADGPHSLKLTVRDRAGLSSVAEVAVTVDRGPPGPPIDLIGRVVPAASGPPDVRLDWQAPSDSDVVAYRVMRGSLPITPVPVPEVSFRDVAVPSGTHAYAVVAVDRAGNESAPATVTLRVGVSTPVASILTPRVGAAVGIPVEIMGTATDHDDFAEYRLSAGFGEAPLSFTLVRRGTVPVVAGALGTWIPPAGGTYVIRLQVADVGGNTAEVSVSVTVDLDPPSPPTLVSLDNVPDPASLTASWQPSPDADVAGYLVYRGGHIANATDLLVGDPTAFLVPGPAYRDAGLRDGPHCYRVVAVDGAGNRSSLSNELCRALDNHLPRATIVEPLDGTRFAFPIRLFAASADADIAAVQFQLRPASGGPWEDLGTADPSVPFEATLDPSGRSLGAYEVRARASEASGRADADPPVITLTYGDTSPPPRPQGLSAVVDGALVRLEWQPSTATDLAGYRVYVDGGRQNWDPRPAATFSHTRTPGRYEYRVTAVDQDGNESVPSDGVEAHVYAVSLDVPFPVVPAPTATLTGSGAAAGSDVDILEEGTTLASAPAGPEGRFSVADVPLTPGPHFLQARGRRGGDRSTPSNTVLLISNAPPAPVSNLQASATVGSVELSWDATPDPEAFGYVLERDGVNLTPATPALVDGVFGTEGLTTLEEAIDGDPETAWIPDGAPAHIGLTFATPVLVESIALEFAGFDGPAPLESYRIVAEWNGQLVPFVVVESNASASVVHRLPSAFATAQIRILVESDEGVGIAEVAVNGVSAVPVDTPSYADSRTDGRYVYRVAVIDRYGAVSALESLPVTVGDVDAPAAPVGLSATVKGSDVALSWQANGEPDLATYVVVRDGTRVATVTTPAFVDRWVENGLHRYAVIAVDYVGNESPESAPVTAAVAVMVPTAPVLSGSVAPSGEVDLTWEHPGASHFAVRRSVSAGGPYTEVARLGDVRSYHDGQAPRGRPQYYVVQAVDDAGNASALSNEVVLTPRRTQPLAVPVILAPTVADRPITTDLTRTTVGGRAEPATLVSITRGTEVLASSEAAADFQTIQRLPVPPDAYAPAVSADLGTVAYTIVDGFNSRLRWVDLASGEERELVPPEEEGSPETGRFSPDGRRLTYFFWTPSAFRLYVLDLDSGASTLVEEGVWDAGWSPDGATLALVGRLGSEYTLWLQHLGMGQRTILASGVEATAPRFAPDGTRVAVREWSEVSSRWEIVVYGVSGGDRRAVDDSAAEDATASWSPDGARLAFTSVSGARARVRSFDLVTGQVSDVTDGTFADFGAQWEPLGEWLTFSRFDPAALAQTLVARRLSTGEERVIADRPSLWGEPETLPIHEWLSNGRLAAATRDPVAVIAAPGYFEAVDVALRPGVNELVARSFDPESASASDPSRPVQVTVAAENFSDLHIGPGDLGVYPALPTVGQPATLSVRVRNDGALAAEAIDVAFQVLDESGQLVLEHAVIVPRLSGASAVVVSAPWSPVQAGTFLVRATVDGANQIVEPKEDDNSATLGVYVAAGAAVVVEAETDQAAYPGGAPVGVTVRLRNAGPAFAGVLRTILQTTSGQPVAEVDQRTVSLAYAQQSTLALAWNTGTVEAGDYRLAVGIEGGAVASVPLGILSDLSVRARVVPDHSIVGEGEPLGFALRIENQGTNESLEGAAVRLRVVPAGGSLADFETSLVLGTVLPGGLWESRATWPVAGVPGAYTVELEVTRGPAPLAAAGAAFRVEPRAPLVAGSLSLEPPDLLAGTGLGLTATIRNLAGEARPDVAVAIEVSGTDGGVLARHAQTVSLGPGETVTLPLTLPLAGIAAGRYPVFLRAGAPAATLDRKTVHVHGVLTAPSVDAPAVGSRVATEHPVLTVNNATSPEGAALTYEFQLFRDEALTQAVRAATGVPEGAGRTPWMVAVTLAEDHTYYWRARATDEFSSSPWTGVASFMVDVVNRVPAAPVPDRPGPGARVASREPVLTVRNADDPEREALLYEFRVGLDAGLQTIVASATGIEEGPGVTSWGVPVTLDENQTYYWSARAHDPVQASAWSFPVSFMVDTVNDPPPAPMLLRPAPEDEVATRTPELAAQAVVDPEGDSLTYTIEVDEMGSFDSSQSQVSGPLVAQDGTVVWTVPASLRDNTLHHWRARASDGSTEGAWSTARFFVNVSNDAPSVPVPVDPADGGVVSTLAPVLRVRNATDLDRDTLTYDFEVRDAAEVVVAAASGIPETAVETGWTVAPDLTEDAPYTWTVRASDGEIASAWSAASGFRVNATLEPPSAPTPVAPAEGASIHDTARPTLSVANAVSPEGLALTYEFEVYAVSSGTPVLVVAATGVPEGVSTSSWTVTVDLNDGLHNWRSRAFDGVRLGPWSTTAHFTMALDQPPAAPTGVAAEPGDGEVRLTWTPNDESDVVAYRVQRATVSGGPYALVAETAGTSFVDGGLFNGTTYFYVVTARDDQFESDPSLEVAATPRPGRLAAEIHLSPDTVAPECLADCGRDRCGRGGNGWPSNNHHGGNDHDDDHDDDDDDHDDHDDDDGVGCPSWLNAAIELPSGTPPWTIVVWSVRLAGSVTPDPWYWRFTDVDHDGRPELTLRFRWSAVRPLLAIGVNPLRVTGRAGSVEFEGVDTVTVSPLRAELRISPRTLHRSYGHDVEARLSFRGCLHGEDVDASSLRLNATVPISRVVSTPGGDLVVKFPRGAVLDVLPAGNPVEVHVTGTVHGLPFDSTDRIRVIK